jgi:hypothetical protein
MSEKLSGIVAEVESYRPKFEHAILGVILRPVEGWCEAIVVGKDIKHVLSNGDCYQARVIGGEIGENLKWIMVKDIPGIANEDLLGAILYVLAE